MLDAKYTESVAKLGHNFKYLNYIFDLKVIYVSLLGDRSRSEKEGILKFTAELQMQRQN